MSDNVLTRLLAEISDVVEFTPTKDHRRAKSNFWTSVVEQDVSLPPDPDMLTVARYAGDRRLEQWWDIPGFRDWFLNRQEFMQRVDTLTQLALDEMERILTSTDPKSNTAKVAVMRMALEAGGKLGANRESSSEETTDDKILRMTRKELEEFIQEKNRLLLPDPKNSN